MATSSLNIQQPQGSLPNSCISGGEGEYIKRKQMMESCGATAAHVAKTTETPTQFNFKSVPHERWRRIKTQQSITPSYCI